MTVQIFFVFVGISILLVYACQLIKYNLSSNSDRDGNTLAHMAGVATSDIAWRLAGQAEEAEGGHLEAVRLMLDNGVSASDENKFGFTPVHLDAKCGHADVFDVFAKSGVSLRNPSSKIGMTALHIASYYGEEEIARELFKHIPASTRSAQPTRPETALIPELAHEAELTPLHLAAYSGSENVVRAILNQG